MENAGKLRQGGILGKLRIMEYQGTLVQSKVVSIRFVKSSIAHNINCANIFG